MTDKNILSGFSFFSDVDPATMEAIAGKGEILEFKAEDVIFHVDEPATHFYGLLEGEVDLVLVFTDKVLKTDIEYEEAIQATIVDEEKEIIVLPLLDLQSEPSMPNVQKTAGLLPFQRMN
jgi:hypothetical protein